MELRKLIKMDRQFWFLVAVFAVAGILIWYRSVIWPGPTTTVYLVRHAEKADSSSNPPLSAAGQVRAQELARVLRDEGIDAVFVTEFTRTQQTGAPLAASIGVTPQQYPASDTQGLVDTILADHVGDRVLVVGHSNTVDDIALVLGANGLSDLEESQFDRLFVINRIDGLVNLNRLRYGADTP